MCSSDLLDKLIAEQMKAAGGSVVLLTSTLNSPSTQAIINGYSGLKHVQYDAVSYSGMLLANEACGFGKNLPSYDFAAADVIVSLGADFLGSWLSPVEFAKGYSVGRKIDAKNPRMSKHYQFESYLSLTGSSADERFVHRPSQTGTVALALLSALNGGAVALSDAKTLCPAIAATDITMAAPAKSRHGFFLLLLTSIITALFLFSPFILVNRRRKIGRAHV